MLKARHWVAFGQELGQGSNNGLCRVQTMVQVRFRQGLKQGSASVLTCKGLGMGWGRVQTMVKVRIWTRV